MTGLCSSLDVMLTAIPALSASALMGSNWPSTMTVWILNPLLLYKWLNWRRYCRRVAVFELVICSDTLKRMCREMVIKNCTPLINIMSAHRIIVTYFNLMKVVKEETFGGSTAYGVFLDVLPCSNWMLGPRISSATLTCSLVMGQKISSAPTSNHYRVIHPGRLHQIFISQNSLLYQLSSSWSM